MALLWDLIQMLLELGHDLVSTGASRTSTSLSGIVLRDDISVYKRNFKKAFLGESQDFYRTESTSQLSRMQATMGPGSSLSIPGASGPRDTKLNDSKPLARYSAMEYIQRA
jgi:hypothetical protein